MVAGEINMNTYMTALDEGRSWIGVYRKLGSQNTTAGTWVDMSMATGYPVPNYYASTPLESAYLDSKKGVFTGGNVAPAIKQAFSTMTMTNVAPAAPHTQAWADYLMYYPTVDMDSTDQQDLDNLLSLPRYVDGKGVRAFFVAQAPYTGGATYQINYTNSDGVSGRLSPICTSSTAGTIGALISGSHVAARSFGPFIPLQSNDDGMRSIESVTFFSPNGGVGALVLCKPLFRHSLRDNIAPHERFFLHEKNSSPIIKDGAYVHFLAQPTGNIIGAPIVGELDVIWQ
jgi:hypothetical protein